MIAYSKSEIMDKNSKKKNTLAAIGSIIGFIALVFAFLSPWIADAIDPPDKPVEESVVDFATKLKNAAAAKMKGEEYEGELDEKVPSDYLPPVVIAFGMIGVGFGLGSFFAGEKKSFAGCAVTLGVSAAVVQWSIVLVAALLIIFLVVAVLGALGIS
jgi:hypothetical protein